MEIPNIDDSKVRDFSDGAKQELQTQSKIMIEELINEINRVERVRNAGTATEITQSDVLEAVKESSKKIHHHKKKVVGNPLVSNMSSIIRNTWFYL